MNEYLLRLKKLAKFCKFKNVLEENLRDQFIYGLNNERLRQRILSEREVTFKRTIELASAMEAAERESRLGGGNGSSCAGEASSGSGGAVLAVRGGGEGPRARRARGSRGSGGGGAAARARSTGAAQCYRCGSRQHSADVCAFANAKCYKCDKVGHISHMCKSSKVHKVYHVDESDSDEVTPNLYRLEEASDSDGPWFCKLNVEGVILQMQVDSGSSVSAISKRTYNESFPGRPLHSTNQ